MNSNYGNLNSSFGPEVVRKTPEVSHERNDKEVATWTTDKEVIAWSTEKEVGARSTDKEVVAQSASATGQENNVRDTVKRRRCSSLYRKRILALVVVAIIIIIGAVAGGVAGSLAEKSSIAAQNSKPTDTASQTATSMPSLTSSSSPSSSVSPSSSATSSSTTSAVTSGTTGMAAIDCTSKQPTTYTSPFGSAFLRLCYVDWPVGERSSDGTGFIQDISTSTEYFFEECMDACAQWNNRHATTRCGGVTYNANLTSSVGNEGGNCFLKDKPGVDVTSTSDVASAAVAD